MKTLIEKIFGVNWRTTVSGGVCSVALAITINPSLVAFLPESWQKNVQGVAGFIAFLAGGTFASVTKASNVTGIPATGQSIQHADGQVRDIVTPPRP